MKHSAPPRQAQIEQGAIGKHYGRAGHGAEEDCHLSQTPAQGFRAHAGRDAARDTAAEAAAPKGEPVSPDHLLNVAFSFAASKAALSAVELGVFTHVAAHGPQSVA